MTSLFSSFDLFFFYKNFIVSYLLISIIIVKRFFFRGASSLVDIVFKFLSEFFYTLKRKSFNKRSGLVFIRVFVLLFFLNFFSVFSYVFPRSSQVRIVLTFSLSLWRMIILFRIFNSLRKFLYHFIPEGTPLALTFLLFLIELISRIIRPLTLIVRLVANILAGHLLMILLSKLVFIFYPGYLLYIVLNAVEIFVSLIQSYIFSTMLVLYFSEV